MLTATPLTLPLVGGNCPHANAGVIIPGPVAQGLQDFLGIRQGKFGAETSRIADPGTVWIDGGKRIRDCARIRRLEQLGSSSGGCHGNGVRSHLLGCVAVGRNLLGYGSGRWQLRRLDIKLAGRNHEGRGALDAEGCRPESSREMRFFRRSATYMFPHLSRAISNGSMPSAVACSVNKSASSR